MSEVVLSEGNEWLAYIDEKNQLWDGLTVARGNMWADVKAIIVKESLAEKVADCPHVYQHGRCLWCGGAR